MNWGNWGGRAFTEHLSHARFIFLNVYCLLARNFIDPSFETDRLALSEARLVRIVFWFLVIFCSSFVYSKLRRPRTNYVDDEVSPRSVRYVVDKKNGILMGGGDWKSLIMERRRTVKSNVWPRYDLGRLLILSWGVCDWGLVFASVDLPGWCSGFGSAASGSLEFYCNSVQFNTINHISQMTKPKPNRIRNQNENHTHKT